ncbi:MAG: SprB repeat-containing protein, partial [Flavobacterium sp.]|uniref:SprB repeat-containing protein n=1 Tax=Flavobacterium sp. TaxID=239 RepID=UPI0032673373
MKKNFTLTFAMLLCFFCIGLNAQTQFWSDTFEDAGAPSSGTRTVSNGEFSCGGPPSTSYFKRTDPSGISIQNSPFIYSAFQGSKFFAGEDIDKNSTCTNGAVATSQQVTWTVSIAGKSGLSFKGLLAASNLGAWQGLDWETSGPNQQDFVVVEYRIDGGAWTKTVAFYSTIPAGNPTSNPTLNLDTNGDKVGDGAALTYTFTEYSATIPGTGTTMDIRLNCFANGGNQEFAFDNFRLFETPACTAPVVTANPPNRTICSGSNTTFPSTATGATGYQWQVNTGSGFTDLANGAPYSNVTTNTLTITGATAAMSGYLYRCVAYNPTITCFTNTNQATLTVSSINTTTASQTNVSCFGGSNGTASVTPSGGIAPYTYSWLPSGGTAATATGLAAGSYTVTVTDNIACTATRNYTITQPPVLNGTTVVTNVACFGGTNGAINLTPSGGAPGYTFNWGGGITTEDRTGLAAGSYSVTITDSNSCTRTISGIIVTQPTAPVSGTTVVTNVACNGGSNGAINLTPTGGTGPYTFSWGGGITTEDRTGLVAGSYSVTITDTNGCTGTVSGITVTQSTAISTATNSQTNVSCNGGSNGTASVSPSGGAGGYTYNWTPGNPTGDGTASITGLSAGSWTCTVTDANSCTATRTFTVTQPTAIVLNASSQTNVSCFGGSNGAATINTPT